MKMRLGLLIQCLVISATCVLTTSEVRSWTSWAPRATWDRVPVSILVDNVGHWTITDFDRGVTATIEAITSTLAWNGAGSGTLVQAWPGVVNNLNFEVGDGIRMLAFYDPIPCVYPCIAGTAREVEKRSNGTWRILDSDIVTNLWDTDFTSVYQGSCWPGYEFYIESVMVHEVGHLLGMGHSIASTYETMYPLAFACNLNGASTELDDEMGINSLYGTFFYDNFDDAPVNSYFFSNFQTGNRWAVGEHTTGAYCDNRIKLRWVYEEGSVDKVVETKFLGRTGDTGSRFTFGISKAYNPLGGNEQTVQSIFSVTTSTPFGSSARKGRLLTGVVTETGQSQETCSATGQGYTSMVIGGSALVGIDLDSKRAFVSFDPPYQETDLGSLNLTNVTRVSIAAQFLSSGIMIRIFNYTGHEEGYSAETGALLKSVFKVYPSNWNFSGTTRPAFLSHGTVAGTSTNYHLHEFISFNQ